MSNFSKTRSPKDLIAHISTLTHFPNQTTDPMTFIAPPLPLSDSLNVESLAMLTRVDVYRLWYANKGQHIHPISFFYYDGVVSKPALSESKSLIKQKKETDLFLHTLGLRALIEDEHISFIPSFSSRIGQIFEALFLKGDITYCYQSVFWNIRYQTIAPLENIIFKTEDTTAYTIKYFISTKNHSLDVYVEDPSTIFGDVAIAINPLHKKAKILKGQMAIIPIINKTIPIIIDERVDFATHGGIMRIIPGHDSLSLNIAKDHGLPLDVYSFDSSGNFSDHAGLFAGKPVSQFTSNIIQNLSDIGNLIDQRTISIKVPYSRLTDERLFVRTHKGWFLEIPEWITEKFSQEIKAISGFEDHAPLVSKIFPVSTPSSLGYRIPIWEKLDGTKVLVNEKTIVTSFMNNKKNEKNILLSLFVFHAIQEGSIANTFALEDIISVFFAPGFVKDQSLLESWISLYATRYPQFTDEIKQLNHILKSLQDNIEDDQAIENLLCHFEESFGIVSDTKGFFSIDLSLIDPNLHDAIQSKETIITYLLHHILVLDTCGFFDDRTIQYNSVFTIFSEHERNKFGNYSLLAYYLKNEFPWGKAFLYDSDSISLFQNKRDTQDIRQYVHIYGSDIIRCHLIDIFNGNTMQSEESLEHIQNLLQTFWNASRYIKTTLFKNESELGSLQNLYEDINESIHEAHAFDTWILGALQNILDEKIGVQTPIELSKFFHKILQFMKEDFSTKYLELIKNTPSPLSSKIALLVNGVLVKLFLPYTPLLATEIWGKMGYEGHIMEKMSDIFFPTLQKSYLITLFMDIVDKFSNLKASISCKKHDPVSMFIKSNPDFLKFCQIHENLLTKTLHTQEIIYLPYHEQTPNSYLQEEIIDITIGIKRFSKDNPYCLAALTKKLSEKQDYLQHLRNLLNSLNTNGGSPEVIAKKREEIQMVKDEIEGLELDIYKLKCN